MAHRKMTAGPGTEARRAIRRAPSAAPLPPADSAARALSRSRSDARERFLAPARARLPAQRGCRVGRRVRTATTQPLRRRRSASNPPRSDARAGGGRRTAMACGPPDRADNAERECGASAAGSWTRARNSKVDTKTRPAPASIQGPSGPPGHSGRFRQASAATPRAAMFSAGGGWGEPPNNGGALGGNGAPPTQPGAARPRHARAGCRLAPDD